MIQLRYLQNVILFSMLMAFTIRDATPGAQLLCRNWRYGYIEQGGKRIAIPREIKKSILVFNPDGTNSEIPGKTVFHGKCTLDSVNRIIVITERDGTKKNNIKEISTAKLILETGSYNSNKMIVALKSATDNADQ